MPSRDPGQKQLQMSLLVGSEWWSRTDAGASWALKKSDGKDEAPGQTSCASWEGLVVVVCVQPTLAVWVAR